MRRQILIILLFLIPVLFFCHQGARTHAQEVAASTVDHPGLHPECERIHRLMQLETSSQLWINGGGILENETGEQRITLNDTGDRWTIPIAVTGNISINLSSTLPLRLRFYRGMELLAEQTPDVGQTTISFVADQAGIYTLLVSRANTLDPVEGNYSLTLLNHAVRLIGVDQAQSGQLARNLSENQWLFFNAASNNNVSVSLAIATQQPLNLRVISPTQEMLNQEITAETGPIRLRLSNRGYYSVIVTNNNAQQVNYTVRLYLDPEIDRLPAEIMPIGQPVIEAGEVPVLIDDGKGFLDFTLNTQQGPIEIQAHVDAFTRIANNGNTIRLGFGDDFVFQFRDDVQRIQLLDSNLIVTLRNGGMIYVQDFNWRGRVEDSVGNFRTFAVPASQQEVRVDWESVRQVWMLPNCIGANLTENRRILTEGRNLALRSGGIGDLYPIVVNGQSTYNLLTDWHGLHDIFASNNLITLVFNDNKTIQTNRLALQITQAQESDGHSILFEGQSFISTDWKNIQRIRLTADTSSVEVLDGRGTIERADRALTALETREGVMRLRWADKGESLLLPQSEAFIQIETPANLPNYDSASRPDEIGYTPTLFNNTGQECYPITTAFSYNCAPNGEANPANGNLSLSVTDLALPSNRVPIQLSRTYNSLNSAIDGPFGYGWSTDYITDYNVAFNNLTKTRYVDLTTAYRVALDLTRAPKGEIRFTTPSGSLHVFRQTVPQGDFVSSTLVGWVIPKRIDTLTDFWDVIRPDGLTYTFDRAGRFMNMSHPHGGRVSIARITTSPNTAYEIKDDAGRALILIFDENQHIIRAELVDENGTSLERTEYIYENGYLTQVHYADGSTASYQYEGGLLTAHDDPRAPLAARLHYTYDEGRVINILLDEGQTLRGYAYNFSANVLQTTTRDEWGRSEILAYSIDSTPFTAYRLTKYTDVAGTSTHYTYNETTGFINGFSRNSIVYRIEISPPGSLMSLQQDRYWIDFSATYQTAKIGANTVELLTDYRNNGADGPAQVAIEYDENGRITAYTDAMGLVTRISERYDDSGLPRQVLVQDGTTTETINLVYDARGYLIQRTDNAGIHTLEWDALGRLNSYTDTFGRVYRLRYTTGTTGRCVVIVQPTNNTFERCFNFYGQIVQESIANADGAYLLLTRYDYDELRRLAAIHRYLDDMPLTTRYNYLRGELPGHWILHETFPNGTIQQTEYDALDRVSRTVDIHGQVTVYEYDGQSVIEKSDNNSTIYFYSGAGQLCSINYGDVQWQIYYDANRSTCESAQRYPTRILIASEVGSLLQIDYSYTLAGQPDVIEYTVRRPDDTLPTIPILEEKVVVRYVYDSQGRVIQRNSQNGAATLLNEYSYSNNGEHAIRITQTDGTSSQAINKVYDRLNRLIRIESGTGKTEYLYADEPNGHVLVTVVFSTTSAETARWQLRYDGAGNLREWVNQNSERKVYTYDTLGRLTNVTLDERRIAAYTYNENNQVTAVTNEYGRAEHFVYDQFGQLVTRRGFDGVVTSYGYDPRGNLTGIIDALGYTTVFAYDGRNQLNQITYPAGQISQFDWGTDRRAGHLRYVSPTGETNYYFDLLGRLWQIVDGTGSQHLFRYDSGGYLSAYESWNKTNLVQLSYNAAGQLRSIDGPNAWNWVYEYDSLGRLITRIDPDERRFSLEYDPLGRLTQVTHEYAGFSPFQRTYNHLEPNAITITDTDSQTRLLYDSLYHLIENSRTIATGDTAVYRYLYDSSNENFLVTYPDRSSTQVTYSSSYDIKQGVFITVRDISPNLQLSTLDTTIASQLYRRERQYIYNPRGDLVSLQTNHVFLNEDFSDCIKTTSDVNDCVWRYVTSESATYDPEKRPLSYQDAGNNISTYTYDIGGHLTVVRNPDGNTYQYRYDGLGQLIAIINPAGQILNLTYANGNIESISLNNDLIESYGYTPQGWLAARISSVGTEVTYSYSKAGYLSGLNTDDNTHTVTTNASGRIQSIELRSTNQPTVTYLYEYNGDGQIVSANGGGLTYTYNAAKQTTGWKDASAAVTWTYIYDSYGYTLTSDDQQLRVIWDDQQRLSQITANGEVIRISYEPPVNRDLLQARIMWGEDYSTVLRFNANGHLVRVLHERRDDVSFDRLASIYTRNYWGLPLFVDEVGQDIFRGYNNLYQLVGERWLNTDPERQSADSPIYVLTLNYDSSGKRASEIVQDATGQQIGYSYNYEANVLGNRTLDYTLGGSLFILAVGIIGFGKRRNYAVALCIIGFATFMASAQTSGQPTHTYRFNSAGHVASITDEQTDDGPLTTEFIYDGLGRITSIESVKGKSRFEYDAFSRLQLWENAGKVVQYHYDGEQLTAIQRDGQLQLLAGTLPNLPLLVTGQQPHWLLYDGLNDLRRAFIGTHNDSNHGYLDMNAFGQFIYREGNLPYDLPIFDGMLYDDIHQIYIGLDGRAYDPISGRYLQEDLLGPDANGNLYNYSLQRAMPLLQKRDSLPFAKGLREYAQTQRLSETLTAEYVSQVHVPQFDMAWQDAGLRDLQQFNDSITKIMNTYEDAPQFIAYRYNPSGAQSTEEGWFSFSDNNVSTYTRHKTIIESDDHMHITSTAKVWSPEDMIALLSVEPIVPSWRDLDDWRQPSHWTVSAEYPEPERGARAPNAIAPILSYPLTDLSRYADLFGALENLPTDEPELWTSEIENAVLPSAPQMPVQTMKLWLDNWFTADTLPVWEQLRRTSQLPNAPEPIQPMLFPR